MKKSLYIKRVSFDGIRARLPVDVFSGKKKFKIKVGF